jgi:NADPH:quinone reductase-like Zn-dependent oxidoreductase
MAITHASASSSTSSSAPSPSTTPGASTRTWELPAFGLDRLVPGERQIPRLAAHDLLVRVSAVSLNYRDLRVGDGTFVPDLALPAILASDAAGVVVATGGEVTRFQPGDRVMTQFLPRFIDGRGDTPAGDYVSLGGPLQGVLSEYLVLDEQTVVSTPAYLTDAEASTLPIAALTAWVALFDAGQLRPGQTVLVEGTGGVSLFGLQLAVAAGARVFVTSSSDEKLARAKALGAAEGINYVRHPEWDREVLARTNDRGVDHILEVAGGESVSRAVRALARGGHLAIIGLIDGLTLNADIPRILHRRLTIRGVLVGSRHQFETMNRALETLRIQPIIDRVYPFAETPAAFAHLARGAFGKVVVEVAG